MTASTVLLIENENACQPKGVNQWAVDSENIAITYCHPNTNGKSEKLAASHYCFLRRNSALIKDNSLPVWPATEVFSWARRIK